MEGQTFLGIFSDVAIAVKLIIICLDCDYFIFRVIRFCPFTNTRFWLQSFVLLLLLFFVEQTLVEVILRLILFHSSVFPKRSLNYFNLCLARWFYSYFNFALLLSFCLYLCDIRHLLFALAEVQTLYMKYSGYEVDKEKPDYSSIYVDDVIDIYFKEADYKANENHEYKVTNFPNIHLLFLWLRHTKYSEYSFP